jgi:hypothetical protein
MLNLIHNSILRTTHKSRGFLFSANCGCFFVLVELIVDVSKLHSNTQFVAKLFFFCYLYSENYLGTSWNMKMVSLSIRMEP